ncbi:hypothetical protein OAX78_01010 [Planctomycetota bacterium]|nr:hypothetical protein [Planctomycetota bacterium]
MIAKRVKLSALWCDQGMAHMLETFESQDEVANEVPLGIALFDFGADLKTLKKSVRIELATPAVRSVQSALASQKAAGRTPLLNFVVVSHQDQDHYSLLNYLMNEVGTASKGNMYVGAIVKGGCDWSDGATKTIERLRNYGLEGEKANVTTFTNNFSHYPGPTKSVGSLGTLNGVNLRVLLSNKSMPQGAEEDIRRNATSAVMVIDFENQRIILPGDATWETLKAINTKLKKWSPGSPVRPVVMMSVPHHGSLRTMDPSNKVSKDSTVPDLASFLALTQPQTSIASAGAWNQFHHPSELIIDEFRKHATPRTSHPIVVFTKPRAAPSQWAVQHPQKATFTTTITLGAPPRIRNYYLEITKDQPTLSDSPVDGSAVPVNHAPLERKRKPNSKRLGARPKKRSRPGASGVSPRLISTSRAPIGALALGQHVARVAPPARRAKPILRTSSR